MDTNKDAGSILNPEFVWTSPVSTDVQATWRRFGWIPPSEQKKEPEKAA